MAENMTKEDSTNPKDQNMKKFNENKILKKTKK
jgi:hypothetical protein